MSRKIGSIGVKRRSFPSFKKIVTPVLALLMSTATKRIRKEALTGNDRLAKEPTPLLIRIDALHLQHP
jgi:hypothetical protein